MEAMFIKWRTYQRQHKGIKADKYIQQPIIVKSFRVGKKLMKEINPNMPNEAFDMPEIREKVFRPRHKVLYKLPSFPMCMVVYFRDPRFMADRLHWWEGVDTLFEKLPEVCADMTEEVIEKLKAEIERVVPRLTPAEIERIKVVLNDLPLHL
jgi:hypothetical protein